MKKMPCYRYVSLCVCVSDVSNKKKEYEKFCRKKRKKKAFNSLIFQGMYLVCLETKRNQQDFSYNVHTISYIVSVCRLKPPYLKTKLKTFES